MRPRSWSVVGPVVALVVVGVDGLVVPATRLHPRLELERVPPVGGWLLSWVGVGQSWISTGGGAQPVVEQVVGLSPLGRPHLPYRALLSLHVVRSSSPFWSFRRFDMVEPVLSCMGLCIWAATSCLDPCFDRKIVAKLAVPPGTDWGPPALWSAPGVIVFSPPLHDRSGGLSASCRRTPLGCPHPDSGHP